LLNNIDYIAKIDGMNMTQKLKAEIAQLVKKASGVSVDPNLITVPPKAELGDLAVPLFSIAKAQSKNPVELAKELSLKIKSPQFSKVAPAGPYLNFFVNTNLVAQELLGGILNKGEMFGANQELDGQRIMVEYFSPNTNKPMTVGHLRNLIIGSTMSRLLKKSGAKVFRACLYNDRGIAIAKAMVAYELFGNGSTPTKAKVKSDQFVGHYYVLFGQKENHSTSLMAGEDPTLEQKAQDSLRLWEAGDKKTMALWKKMMGWVIEGFELTLKKLHEEKYDKLYQESKIYTLGKDIVLKNIGNGVIKKGETGEVLADLSAYNLPDKILLRSDGTSLYIIQDIVLASIKDELKLDRSIHVIGDEQNLQMKQLFAVLESLGQPKEKFFHLSYGMMRLPEGKIKSREGFGKALADDLIQNLETLALKEIDERNPSLSRVKKVKIANQIMNAALKFYILNVDPVKTMIFNPEEAVSFAGKTGPYLQYTAVRMNSVLKGQKVSKKIDGTLLNTEIEKQLINKLRDYPQEIERATKQYSPSILTHYLFELAQLANTFYHDVSVLKAEKEIKQARLVLVKAIELVLEDGLGVCGIEVPEKM